MARAKLYRVVVFFTDNGERLLAWKDCKLCYGRGNIGVRHEGKGFRLVPCRCLKSTLMPINWIYLGGNGEERRF